MAQQIPDSSVEVDERMRTDVAGVVDESKPFVINSFWGGIISALANGLYDFYLVLREAIRESIPDKAIIKLPRWAAIHKILQLASTPAEGPIDARGTLATAVPVATVWLSGDGERYENALSAAMAVLSITIPAAGLTRSGTTVTLTTTNPHELAGSGAGYELKIVGSDEALYNLNPLPNLAVTGPNTLTFDDVTSSGDTPAGTGTLELANVAGGRATIQLRALTPGAAGNQLANAQLSLSQPISGMLEAAHVTQALMGGGLDQEDIEALRIRYLERVQDPIAHFNDAEIISTAKLVNGVTRVFVFRREPTLGTVTIYFVRDVDDDLIPSPGEVTDVLTALTGGIVNGIEFPGIHPANMSIIDVVVAAPTALTVDFVFTSLTPDTPEMRAAVTANLGQFFDEEVSVAVDIKETKLWQAIAATIDTATGLELEDFAFTTPAAGDIDVDDTHPNAEIPKLGTITYP